MACYLNQYWLTIKEAFFHSFQGHVFLILFIRPQVVLEFHTFAITAILPRLQWVKLPAMIHTKICFCLQCWRDRYHELVFMWNCWSQFLWLLRNCLGKYYHLAIDFFYIFPHLKVSPMHTLSQYPQWRHIQIYWPTMVQMKTCCLTTSSHYPNQFWIEILNI